MRYVIGSGPAGIACAHALVSRGWEVTMLDAGLTLEPQRQKIVELMSQTAPDRWEKAHVEMLKEGMSLGGGGVPLKYVYGSDFPYREADRYIPLRTQDVENLPSLAKGGLSNVWGGGLLPFLPRDIASWPLSIEELAPHYKAVLSFLPISAVIDDLAAIYPLYTEDYQTLNSSRQALDFLADLKRHQSILEREGFKFGRSRLAVRARPSDRDLGCVYCGLCMYGCPYGLIYNSASTLEYLMAAKNFHYINNIIVEKLVESNASVQILARDRRGGKPRNFRAEKVYLAGGVLPTTKILLESLDAYQQTVTIKDSQYFLLPLLRYRRTKDVETEDLHTLQQVFLEIFDTNLSENTIHLAIYTYNEMYRSFFQEKLGRLYPLFKFLISQFLDRLILAQGYLHSQISPTISASLQEGETGSPSQLILQSNPNPQTQKVLRKLLEKLWRNQRYLKGIPLQPMMRVARAGRSFHIGGSFPMKANPSAFESDIWGRPTGFKRVHAVDSTTFPSIPATTITLTVMANAHRIGANTML